MRRQVLGFSELRGWKAVDDGFSVTMADNSTMLFVGADAVDIDRRMRATAEATTK
jgi:hypothetical protein